jgi:hypothetical protein
VIIYIFYYNSRYAIIGTSILLPLSIDKISFWNDISDPFQMDLKSEKEEKFYLWNDEEIKDFLKSLDMDDNYIVYIEFHPADLDWDAPYLYLSKPFLINKHSSSTTIRKFIDERLDLMVDLFYLEDIVILPDIHIPGPIVKFTYYKIHMI